MIPARRSTSIDSSELGGPLPDARAIADELTARQIRLSLGGSVCDPTDAVGRLLFNVLAMVAEFEADLIRLRTREGMKVPVPGLPLRAGRGIASVGRGPATIEQEARCEPADPACRDGGCLRRRCPRVGACRDPGDSPVPAIVDDDIHGSECIGCEGHGGSGGDHRVRRHGYLGEPWHRSLYRHRPRQRLHRGCLGHCRGIRRSASAAHRSGADGQVKRRDVEREHAVTSESCGRSAKPPVTTDPLDDKLWGLRMVKADRARKFTSGKKNVLVGVLDTGIDASNPDIAPNFSFGLSRNFAPDMPVDELGQVVDGLWQVASCRDPIGTDDGGHGTHVAGTIGAAANGFGVSGVAPSITLVELKGGQDSGFFFLQPTVDAIVYAGDAGLDVVNMWFFVDPWLYNCQNNPPTPPSSRPSSA